MSNIPSNRISLPRVTVMGRQLEDTEPDYMAYYTSYEVARDALITKDQEIERLREALERYGRHGHPNCHDLTLKEDGRFGPRNGCLCGLDTALSGRSSPETKSPQSPIAKITVQETGWKHDLVTASLYAPGLPPGEYDVYLDPTAPGLTQETKPDPTVRCLCGWQGKVSELVKLDSRHECPACMAEFRPIDTLNRLPVKASGDLEVRKLYNETVDELNREQCASIGHEFRPIDSSGQIACMFCNEKKV